MFISLLFACSGLQKDDVRYVSTAYTPVTKCKFILDFKSFKLTGHGPMFTSNGFRLYNTKTFFSINPVLSCFSAVTLHSSKISDSVRPDRSLIVTIKVLFQ